MRFSSLVLNFGHLAPFSLLQVFLVEQILAFSLYFAVFHISNFSFSALVVTQTSSVQNQLTRASLRSDPGRLCLRGHHLGSEGVRGEAPEPPAPTGQRVEEPQRQGGGACFCLLSVNKVSEHPEQKQ